MQEPRLSVVVPVFNQEHAVVENVGVIRERVLQRLGGEGLELLVVSDGSIDRTQELLLESRLPDVRVLHYDRNLGKGYAIKLGALEARGRWIGYVDADLDLDPASLADYVEHAEREGLDFAIGSKRHPASQVHYPPARRVASWCFQQLVRLLFRLDVRDTQVGLKVFHREVRDQVVPLLLVKRFAFDLELLAVARALGFGRIEERPIVLEYRFTGSGVRSVAVLRALLDTLAVFYRLRLLRYYQRRRALAGAYGWTRPSGFTPWVTVVTASGDAPPALEYPTYDVVEAAAWSSSAWTAAAERAAGPVLAFLQPGGNPGANWLAAAVPFIARRDVAAVVCPNVAPAQGSDRARAAAAVSESRVGAGSLYYRYTPGNIRYVRDFPGRSLVVEREAFLQLVPAPEPEEVVAGLAECRLETIYTPETVVVAAPPPLFRPHLARTRAYARARARALRRNGLRALRPSTAALLAFGVFAVAGWPLLLTQSLRPLWLAGWAVYLLALALAALAGALRYRSLRVAALTLVGLVLTHAAYAAALAFGLVSRGGSRGS